MQTEIPSSWTKTTLGALSRVRRGASPRPINSPEWFAADGPGWVRISDVTRSNGRLYETEQRLSPKGVQRSVPVYPGQLIMSICATIGEPVVLEIEACIHDGFVVFDQYEEHLDTRFLFHFIRYWTPSFRGQGQTGTQANLNTNIVNTTPILLPPLDEQKRIAEILDTAASAIQHTRNLIAKLKQVKAGLLQDLLTRGLDKNGQLRDPAAHPEQFKMVDGFGRVPLDWGFLDLNSVSLKIQDGTHYSPQSKEGPYRYITSKNVRFGRLDLTDCGWISEEEHRQIYARCDVKFNDVLLTKDGANTGNAALNTLKEPFSLLSSVAFIRPNTNYLVSKFVLQYLLSPVGQKRLRDLISGLAITRLTLEKIKAFKVPLPSIKEQKRITAILDAHDERILAEEAYLHKLEKIKTGLMQDLLNGKVRI